eukprot:4556689-Pleurochrysis_carterae.AAC.1
MSGEALGKRRRTPREGRPKVREGEQPRGGVRNKVVRPGMGEGERKQRELDGAGGVCARASVAT